MFKQSGQPKKTVSNDQGLGLRDPGPALQITQGGQMVGQMGVPNRALGLGASPGGPDFANNSFAGQLGRLPPQILQQLAAAPQQQQQAAPDSPQSFFDMLRQRIEELAKNSPKVEYRGVSDAP